MTDAMEGLVGQDQAVLGELLTLICKVMAFTIKMLNVHIEIRSFSGCCLHDIYLFYPWYLGDLFGVS